MERNKISTWSDCRRCFPRLLRVLGPIKQGHLYWKSSLSRLVLKSVHCAAKKMKRKDWKVCTCTHSEMLQKFAWLFWALAAGGSLCEGSMCKRNLMRASIIVWAKPDQNPEEGGMNSDLCIWGMSWDFREQRRGETFQMGENQNPREACAPGTTSPQAAPWAMFSSLGSWDTAKLKYHIFIIDSILCFKNLRTSKGRHAVRAKLLQLCSTLRDPMDCSPPASFVLEILQVRTLEWVAMPSSWGSSWPRDRIQVSYVSCTGKWVLQH